MEFTSAILLALIITGGWGVYCYMLGRRHGQNDLLEDFLEHNIIYIDEDGFIHSGKATPLPRPKRKRAKKEAPKAPKRMHKNDDDFTPPSAPAV